MMQEFEWVCNFFLETRTTFFQKNVTCLKLDQWEERKLSKRNRRWRLKRLKKLPLSLHDDIFQESRIWEIQEESILKVARFQRDLSLIDRNSLSS